MRTEVHHELHREKHETLAAHRKLASVKAEHAHNLRAHPLDTDAAAFLRYSRNVAEAAEALHRIGQVEHAAQLTAIASRLYYFSI